MMSYDSTTWVNEDMIDMLIPSISEINQLQDFEQMSNSHLFQNPGFI